MSTSESQVKMERRRTEETTGDEVARPDEGESDSDFSSEMLRITINDEKMGKTKTYNVHKSLICSKCPYFVAMKNFEEGHRNHVTLPGIGQNAFRQILNWIYAGNFRKDELHDTKTLVETWIIADRFLMTHCKNMAMDELRDELTSTHMTISLIQFIDDFKPCTNEPLVQFVVDQYAYECIDDDNDEIPYTVNDLRTLRDDMAGEITTRIFETAWEWRKAAQKKDERPTPPACYVGCQHHEHGRNEHCYL